MAYDDLIVLIPSHSLEDFPVELAETDGVSLLNSFAVAWHPQLLAAAKVLPRWHRADDPPEGPQARCVFLPKSCESWVPAGWVERVAREGTVVVRNCGERSQMVAAATGPLEPAPALDPDLAQDFLALGFCYLQIELLTRKMRHFSNLDEVHLQREAVAAAEAAVAGDGAAARMRLKTCFGVLTEARERFYPVECYLLDLCLLTPSLTGEPLGAMLGLEKPLSLLASGADLEQIAAAQPDVVPRIKELWDRGVLDVICGSWSEAPLPLLPLGSVLWQLRAAAETCQTLFGRRPKVWGVRRYGVSPQLPQWLKGSGFVGALHTVLDDGIYPDAEHSKMRWEGVDGTTIDALSRIPLAADTVGSYLRFADRMSESMDNDQVAAVIFARWPEVKTPFFDDLRRMQNYSPCLGRWVSLTEFFEQADAASRVTNYRAREYLTPFYVQAVAREERDPLSRYLLAHARRHQLEATRWYAGLEAVLRGGAPASGAARDLERRLETLPEPPDETARGAVDTEVREELSRRAEGLARLIMTGATAGGAGYVVLNPLAFRRVVSVSLPEGGSPPVVDGKSSWLQWDAGRRWLTVDVPGSGYVWLPATGTASSSQGSAAAGSKAIPLAEPYLLRNEFFEVHIHPETGGIQQLKGYGRVPNRLSQQVNFRWARERSWVAGTGDEAEKVVSHYGEMRCLAHEVVCAGPAMGEVRTSGEIVDQTTGQKLAGFEQRVRVWRGRPVVELDIRLDIVREPEAEAWHSYYASRFAWNDEAAALSRSAMMGVEESPEERIESPHYLEIATETMRTTILTGGLPFHRKSGHRMLDCILVPAGETQREFRLAIAFDQPYPMQAALDFEVPAAVVPTESGPPPSGTAGWFFHVNTRSVQILELLPVVAPPPVDAPAWYDRAAEEPPAGSGCGVRLLETEGRAVRVQLRCVRTPVRARKRDLQGTTEDDLRVDGDAVAVDMGPFELADVEVMFE